MSGEEQRVQEKLSVEFLDGVQVLVFRGEFDLSNCDRITRTFEEHNGGASDWVFDLEGIDFLDSTIVVELIRCDRKARESGYRTAFVLPKRQMLQSIFDVLGLAEMFTIRDSRARAIESILS